MTKKTNIDNLKKKNAFLSIERGSNQLQRDEQSYGNEAQNMNTEVPGKQLL